MAPVGYLGAYTASKSSFTYLLQYLAGDVQVDHCQILSVHPGTVFTEGAQAAGCTEDMFEYDSGMISSPVFLKVSSG